MISFSACGSLGSCSGEIGTRGLNHVSIPPLLPKQRPIHFAAVSQPAPAGQCEPAAASRSPPAASPAAPASRLPHLARPAARRSGHAPAVWRTGTTHHHPTTIASPDRRGGRGSRTHDPRTGPCPRRSAPASPSRQSPCAYRSRRPPTTPECPLATRSPQQLDHLAQCPWQDLAANHHPRAAAKLDLDKPGPLRPSSTRVPLRLRFRLDRHRNHLTRLDHCAGFLRQLRAPPFEQLIGVHVVPPCHDRY